MSRKAKLVKFLLMAGVVGFTGAFAIWAKKQYNKLLTNQAVFSSYKIVTANLKELVIEVVYNYVNNMDFDVVITDQKYYIYLDNVYMTKLENTKTTILKKNTTTPITLTLRIELSKIPADTLNKLGMTALTSLIKPAKSIMHIDMKFKVKFGFITIPVPYSYDYPFEIPQLFGDKKK